MEPIDITDSLKNFPTIPPKKPEKLEKVTFPELGTEIATLIVRKKYFEDWANRNYNP